MKYISDPTGRFSHRPFYEPGELDVECERLIAKFTGQSDTGLAFPISTDTLTKLIERDADDLDLYADLIAEGVDVEGVTDFYPGQRPKVRIAAHLSEDERRAHRLRTTLTHEYGHVWLHKLLFDGLAMSLQMFPELTPQESQRCKRESIMSVRKTDWMEWQAGYVCGAILMPITPIKQLVADFRQTRGLFSIRTGSPEAIEFQRTLSEIFDVSMEAAKVRLLQLNCLSDQEAPPPAF